MSNTLTPGPELDALLCEALGIAPKVEPRHVFTDHAGVWVGVCDCGERCDYRAVVLEVLISPCRAREPIYPAVSTDWAAMGVLLAAMWAKHGKECRMRSVGEVALARFQPESMHDAHCAHLPTAVALAAAAALGVRA